MYGAIITDIPFFDFPDIRSFQFEMEGIIDYFLSQAGRLFA